MFNPQNLPPSRLLSSWQDLTRYLTIGDPKVTDGLARLFEHAKATDQEKICQVYPEIVFAVRYWSGAALPVSVADIDEHLHNMRQVFPDYRWTVR